MAEKSTDAEMTQRINEVMCHLLDGASRGEILQYISENWGVTDRMGDEYIRRARQQINVEAAKKATNSIEFHLMARVRLYAKCVEVNDFTNARLILADLAKLGNLYPAAPKEPKDDNDGVFVLDFENNPMEAQGNG